MQELFQSSSGTSSIIVSLSIPKTYLFSQCDPEPTCGTPSRRCGPRSSSAADTHRGLQTDAHTQTCSSPCHSVLLARSPGGASPTQWLLVLIAVAFDCVTGGKRYLKYIYGITRARSIIISFPFNHLRLLIDLTSVPMANNAAEMWNLMLLS